MLLSRRRKRRLMEVMTVLLMLDLTVLRMWDLTVMIVVLALH